MMADEVKLHLYQQVALDRLMLLGVTHPEEYMRSCLLSMATELKSADLAKAGKVSLILVIE